MKKIRVENAIGETLCHDLTEVNRNGIRSIRFRRGHIITAEDIGTLLDMGKAHVYAWEPDANEVHEEDAAVELANVLGMNVRQSAPSEGKVALTAEIPGLFKVNKDALKAINSVQDYTVVIGRGNIRVEAGAKLGALRIIPLVTKRENVDSAVEIARQYAPVLEVKPFIPLKTGIIITGSEVFSGRLPDKFEAILRPKLAKVGAEILGVEFAPDDIDAICERVETFRTRGAEVILLTGGMSVDPDDVTPIAIRNCATEFITHGLPMQPGNMLTIAYAGDTLMIGIPAGSLKSPMTSFDVVAPLIYAGEDLHKLDPTALGDCGYCLNCEVCHFPVCHFGINI